MEIKTLCHGGIVTETKQIERNGVKVGIIEGYGATWDVDRGGWDGIQDKFIKGAFTKAIQRHKETGRQVRFKDHHGRTIGGIPIESVKQDDRGVFISAEINLETQQGKEAFSLAKQGVLTDFSIGWGLGEGSSIKDGVRSIPESEMWEFSIVDEPMNPKANITAVKAIDFSTLADVEIRELERAMKEGIKFDNKEAKQIISLMKSAGMLRDEHDDSRDGDLKQLNESLDKLITNCKE
jgi:HK97 family phage prohead protease